MGLQAPLAYPEFRLRYADNALANGDALHARAAELVHTVHDDMCKVETRRQAWSATMYETLRTWQAYDGMEDGATVEWVAATHGVEADEGEAEASARLDTLEASPPERTW